MGRRRTKSKKAHRNLPKQKVVRWFKAGRSVDELVRFFDEFEGMSRDRIEAVIRDRLKQAEAAGVGEAGVHV